jgi:hypothetical protein
MTKMNRQPPAALKCVVFLWGILCLIFLIWTTAPLELLQTRSMFLAFDQAWMHSNPIWPTLTVTAMIVIGAIGIPIICIKTYKGSLQARSVFMMLNFLHVASIVWGAFHISSFLYLAFSLVPIGILITMVSSEEIGKYFAEQNNLSEPLK